MNSLRILILEDEMDDATLMLYYLKKIVYKLDIKIVSTKADFTKMLSGFKPNIIISDYYIPAYSGAEAMALSKQICPNIPFVFITGKIPASLAEDTLINSTDAYLLKDNMDKLSKLIEDIIEDKKLYMIDHDTKNRLLDAEQLIRETREQLAKMK